MADKTTTAAFINRWQGVSASELATAQSFVIELCELLGVDKPHPTNDQAYMFERPVTFSHGDGSTSAGRIDCYKRGHFVLEAKKVKAGAHTKGFDDALLRARAQGEGYARALPAAEGRPPFVLVVDVGHVIEVYAEFSRSGGTYTPYPDPRSHRIQLQQLAEPGTIERLRAIWTDPLSLDPSRISAKVTRRVAAELADLAKSLEASGHPAEQVAGFLTRALFSMFAEDVGLLPAAPDGTGSFVQLLRQYREQPATLAQMLRVFWASMDVGGFNAAIARDVLRFNGKLFKGASADGYVLPLNSAQIDGLLRAAQANWQEVEPAIFGTLLERALDPTERHALGAHYTPRAYVERLVLPTVVEPLRADWANAQAAALVLAHEAAELDGKKREAKLEEARAEVRRFHHQLCTTRVLDPACGSANFLYVTLEHLKRLEGEVINQLEALGETQGKLGLEGETVTLQQLRGIELNERAAALAELVLWIGWLQWHVRTRGLASVAEPVVHDYGNIEHRDAVLAYERAEIATDETGRPITRWDGVTFKKHPVTGEDVPDEAAQVPQWRYIHPRPAAWPQADFIVGNPPFIGNKRMRDALGDGYATALRGAWADMPETADFVMYWWHHAAVALKRGDVRRFGFITTNSITQIFNRRVIEDAGVTLAFAIPDHPWVDSADGAAVRVAMTVGARELQGDGALVRVTSEAPGEDDTPVIELQTVTGLIHPNLSVGANVNSASRLHANLGLSFMGMIPLGAGFWIDEATADRLGRGSVPGLDAHIRRYRNGKDLTDRARGLFALDFYGISEEELRARFPAAYQWLLDRVKPQRDQDKRDSRRRNWWLFAESVPKFRVAVHGLRRYIGTTETAKHRLFSFLDADILPDQKIRSVVSDDALVLGVLSSAVHVQWTLRTGGTLEDRPVYNNSRCFEPFPFPHDDTGLTPALAERIRQLAEQLDAHRKARQAAHAGVTLTGMYNVLDKLRRGEPLNAKDKLVHEQALVSVLQSLHDELDAAVLAAYGWSDLGPVPWADEAARTAWTETLLERLVALNAQRAAEEAAGTVRWLRPEFQDPARRAAIATAAPAPQQAGIEGVETQAEAQANAELDTPEDTAATAAVAPTLTAQPWPPALPDQVRAVAQVLAGSPSPLAVPAIESHFKGKGPWKKGLPRILETLEALGRARRADGERWAA
ncbi:class I SAM-dependent DNA methyltransferase [Hydrogenophaga defluvii]|uniref:site-specific DNA-methyltransferase (adenine-specific) n=1 Tax=Hydrogenophaga defluvii TaxID=249410 RepID=A0ABW2SGD4_9BURK